MEAYTFINKIDREIIRFDHIVTGDSEFGDEYFFTNINLSPIWMTFDKKDIDFLLSSRNIHPQYSMFYNRPNKKLVNFDEYEVHTFTI